MKKQIKSIIFSMKENRFSYIYLMVIIAGILCFLALDKHSLTLDEVSTFTVSLKWQALWHYARTQEGNMWLYFLINHFWIKFGTSEFILRSLSAIFGVLTIPSFYMLVKYNWGEKIAKIALPLLTFNLCFIFFSQTARGYSLSLLLTVLMQYFFLKFIKNTKSKKFFFAYLITSIFAFYAYLLIGLIIVINYIALFLLPKTIPWKKISLTTIGLIIALLPLITSPSFRGHQIDWLTKPPIINFPLTFILLAGGSICATALSFLIIVFFLWKKRQSFFVKSWERFLIFWLILWAGFPILSSFIFSYTVKPIFQPQSFNTSLPGLIILLALGIELISNNKNQLSKILYFMILSLFIVRLLGWYTENASKQVIIPNINPWDWRQAAYYVEANSKPKDSIIFYTYYIRRPFEYYLQRLTNNKKPQTLEISANAYDIGGGTRIPEPNTQLLDDLYKKYNRVWLVLAYNDTSQLGRKKQWKEVENELYKHYAVSKAVNFNQIEIKLFERNNHL